MIHDFALWGMAVTGVYTAWACWRPNLVGMVGGSALFGACMWTWIVTG